MANRMNKLALFCLACLLAFVSACGANTPTPIIITATPDVIASVTATARPTSIPTAHPTPTQETPRYTVVNNNPYFEGLAEFRLPSDDTRRYQVVGAGYEATARYYPASGVRVAPFINRIPLLDNSGRARLRMEFALIAGEFGLRTRQHFEAGECYVLKQRGHIQALDGDMNNLALGARIYLSDNGSALELQEQQFILRDGDYEITWRLSPLQDETTFVEVYLMVRWAEFTEGAVNHINSFEIIEAPEYECPSDATWYW